MSDSRVRSDPNLEVPVGSTVMSVSVGLRRGLVWVAVLAGLLAVACGGGAAEAPTQVGTQATVVTQQSLTQATNDGSGTQDTLDGVKDANDQANSGADGGSASVTIDGVTIDVQAFEDAPIQRCDPDFFGGFWVILFSSPDPVGNPDRVEMAFPGGNVTDPPRIEVVTDAGDTKWIGDESEPVDGTPLPDPNIQWTVDAGTVSGTETLYEENSYYAFKGGQVDELRVADATFEAACPAG